MFRTSGATTFSLPGDTLSIKSAIELKGIAVDNSKMFGAGISSIAGTTYSTYAKNKGNNIYSIVNGKNNTHDGSQWIFVQYSHCPDTTLDLSKGPKLYMVKCSVFNDGYTPENLGCPANGKWPVTSKLDSQADLMSQVDEILIHKTFHTDN